MADRTLKHVCIPGHRHGGMKHCEACAKGKSKKNSFPRSDSESEDILELLHVDLAGPFSNSIKGGKYFMVIVDDRSRYYEVYILKNKSEALGFMKRFTQLHETHTGKKVKCIRSDNGGEFLNAEWDQWLGTKGIRRQLTSPYSAAQNGRAERAVGVLKTGATTLLQQARLPRKFWSAVDLVPTRTRRERRPPSHLQNYRVYAVDGGHQESLEEVMDRVSAMAFHTRRDGDYQEAEAKEIQSMHDHNVWDLVPNEGQRLSVDDSSTPKGSMPTVTSCRKLG